MGHYWMVCAFAASDDAEICSKNSDYQYYFQNLGLLNSLGGLYYLTVLFSLNCWLFGFFS